MKLNTNNNVYILVYASVMVIIVAFLLAFVSSSLKETQENNVRKDVKKQILSALNIEATDATVDGIYEKVVKDNLANGAELTEYIEDFKTSYNGEIKAGKFHVFVATLDNGETKYVFPVYGAGLWGPIWGYVAVNDDKTSVYGVSFNHESETAGLGGEITNKEKFQAQFKTKKVLDENGEVKLTVIKNGTANGDNECDGVAGATLTSKGVGEMLLKCLGNYKEFLNVK